MLQRSRPARLLHTLTGRHVTRCADSPWQSSPEKHIAPCLAHRTGSDIFYFIYNGKTNLNSSIGEFLKHEPFCTESQLVVGYILIFFKSIGTLEIRIRNFISPVSSAHSTPMQWFFLSDESLNRCGGNQPGPSVRLTCQGTNNGPFLKVK